MDAPLLKVFFFLTMQQDSISYYITWMGDHQSNLGVLCAAG